MRDRAVPTAWMRVARASPGAGGSADSGSPAGEVVDVIASLGRVVAGGDETARPPAAEVAAPPDDEEQPRADGQGRADAADRGRPHRELALRQQQPLGRL